MMIKSRLRDVRTGLANRRTMRVSNRKLSDELASFRTTAERSEIDELISRHTAEETEEIREILHRHDAYRVMAGGRPTAGLGGYRG
jgi:hypothetical protein